MIPIKITDSISYNQILKAISCLCSLYTYIAVMIGFYDMIHYR